LKYFRASKREQDRRLAAVVELLGQPEHEPPETIPGRSIERLRSCLERLPERSRTLVGLRYERHLRSDAIAAWLRTNGAAIRMALMRVRTILRDCMARSAGEETGA
jgi:DNA-directed RNA polymerase specialized sigma24 family protein